MSQSPSLNSWLLRAAVACVTPLVVALLGLGSPNALAQQTGPSYDVELIIFRNLDTSSAEQLPAQLIAATGEADADDEGMPAFDAPSAQFPALPPQRLQLGNLAEGLRRSASYRPLAHVGWTQPGQSRDAAQYLDIASLAPSSGLQGRVALTLGRFLHLTVELDHQGEGGQRSAIYQSRRMRSNERHYLDSPTLGVIAIITPAGAQ